MKADDFKSPLAGKVIQHPMGYQAFVPAHLPPALIFDQDLAVILSRADAALSELSGFGLMLPSPHALIGPSIRREAVMSSQIEGTQATLAEVLLDEATPPSSARPDNVHDLQEVQNYIAALDYGMKRLADLPLSLRLVRELHERLMAGVRGHHATPGEFRRSQNWIGPAGSNPSNAAYVPPPVEEMDELLADWERYLHVRGSVPDLIQCAIMHAQFEAIHPFLDGNGRVGRLLITLFLIERDRLPQPLLCLSEFIERHKSDYYALLHRVHTDGDWMSWILYFLAGVEETAKGAALRAHSLLNLRETLVRDAKGAEKLVDRLLSNPYVTIAAAAEVLEVSIPTATRTVRLLESKGILREITGKGWGKIYVATRVLEALELSPNS
jgi:Fic family protein